MNALVRNSPRALVGLLSVSALIGVVGCSDARYHKQRELRRERINHHVDAYRKHEAAGPERIRNTLDIHEKLRKHHQESLKNTCALCKRLHERDLERWRNERDLRRKRVHDQIRGKPEQIDDAWAKLVY